MDTLTYGKPIDLEPRVYTFADVQKWTSGTILRGVPGQTKFTGFIDSGGSSFNIKNPNVTISGVAFLSGGVWIDSVNTNINFDNCEFHCTGGFGGLKSRSNFNGKITNNLFTGRGHGFGIYGDGSWNGLVITNNEFIDMDGGVHWTNGGPGLLIEQNYFKGLRGQALEMQGSPVDAIIQDNWCEHPMWQDIPGTSGGSTYAYSIPFEGGQRTIVRYNVAIAPPGGDVTHQPPSKDFTRIMFEVGSKGLDMHDNYVDGGNDAIAINGAGATGRVYNNFLRNHDHFSGNRTSGETCKFDAAGTQTNKLITNNSSVKLAIDLIARGRPFRNKRYGGVVTVDPRDAQIADLTAKNATLSQALDSCISAGGILQAKIDKGRAALA